MTDLSDLILETEAPKKGYQETMRDWEKVQLAKIAIILNRWKRDPVEAAKRLPSDVSTTGRNLAAGTVGLVGDVASMVPGSEYSIAGQAPTSDELVERYRGSREHYSYWPSMLAAPGPGEFKVAAKAMMGLGKELTAGVAFGHTLFHGTPHKFDKFALESIGTGEGAQAYGHGLYFAESPGVAGNYATQLGGNKSVKVAGLSDLDNAELNAAIHTAPESLFTNKSPKKQLTDFIDAEILQSEENLRGWRQYALDDPSDLHFQARIRAIDAKLSNLASARRSMDGVNDAAISLDRGAYLYEVEIPDEITAKMLDWDAPLSEQPDIHKQLRQIGIEPSTSVPARTGVDTNIANMTGREFYRWLSGREVRRAARQAGARNERTYNKFVDSNRADEYASRALNEAGIPGIRFFDGSSRAGKEGTRNIVVFNPDDITQVKRDGELVYEAAKKKTKLEEVIEMVDKY